MHVFSASLFQCCSILGLVLKCKTQYEPSYHHYSATVTLQSPALWPLSSWRKPCLWVTSPSRPGAVVRSSPAPAARPLPAARPANTKRCHSDTHTLPCWPAAVATNLQVLAALHEVLDIVNDRKVQAKDLEEVHLLLGQVSVGQDLDQVPKVIATVGEAQTELVTSSLSWYNGRRIFFVPTRREMTRDDISSLSFAYLPESWVIFSSSLPWRHRGWTECDMKMLSSRE